MSIARKIGAAALLAACLAGVLSGVLTGCGTVKGAGQDVQAIGDRISGEEPPAAR